SVTGSEGDRKMLTWHFGWMAEKGQYIWFWVKSTGLLIPVILNALLSSDTNKNLKKFYLPFITIFALGNMILFATWSGDNAKMFLFWFIGSVPLVSLVLANLIKSKNSTL